VRLLVEEFGADRRIVVLPHVSDTSAGAVLVDLDQVADFREFTAGAFVLAGAARSVRLDKLHIEGLHRRRIRTERADRDRSLLDSKEAAELLGVPASWLLAQARRDAVPHGRLGKYVRFDAADLERWIVSAKRGPK
jgi:excisionase family DNA binding protein